MSEVKNYAIIDTTTNYVVNTIAWDGEAQFDPGVGFILVQSDIASIGWSYIDGVFVSPTVEQPSNSELALIARSSRDQILRSVYDPGILMALRGLRMASTPEDIAYAEGKITELDIYAQALQEIPEQAGFPQVIVWPATPTK